ncbi:MAG: hypothetical protein R3F14_06510 [Polyangiaceae bacterium]
MMTEKSSGRGCEIVAPGPPSDPSAIVMEVAPFAKASASAGSARVPKLYASSE